MPFSTYLVMDSQPSNTENKALESPTKRIKSTSNASQTLSPKSSRFNLQHTGHSSAEDVSSTSDDEDEHDYATDFTTPATSESAPEDMQPDDVEDFRDREYPQLKGKTYLDHGGTTVGRFWTKWYGKQNADG